MLRKCVLLGILPAAVVLSGCQTTKMTQYQFEEYRVYVSESKQSRQEAIQKCMDDADNKNITPSDERVFSVIMGVKPNTTAAAFCQRYIDAIISGRITYTDYARP